MNMNEKLIRPVAYIKNGFTDKFGIPRQAGRVNDVESEIFFEKEFRSPDAVREIEGFDRLWLIFGFSAAKENGSLTVRPPRLGGNTRVGVFASRSPFRPNGLGLSCVRLVRVDCTDEGPVLVVSGADLLSGTPIYDIKPYLPHADAYPDAKGGYSDAEAAHRIKVVDPDGSLSSLPEAVRKAVVGCIEDDPRPSYQNEGREYGMTYAGYNVRFAVKDGAAEIVSVEKL